MMARNNLPLRLSRPIKVWFNDLLGRIIGLCDMILMDVYRLPYLTTPRVAHRMARWVGDVSWLLRDFPRLSAYKLAGVNWTIVFVGGQQGLLEICHLFFPGETLVPQEIGRIALWSLAKQTQQWVAEGVDLVVCELSPCCPYQPKAAMTFTVPTWIQQVLDISGSRQELLAGGKRRNVRKRLYQAQKAGFGFRFTQSKTDFDYFYDHMYVPFVRSRHGDLALVTPYQDQWRRWFSRGGLILVTQNDQPVAGTLCYVRNGTCFLIESGVLEANPQLVQQNVNTFVVCSDLGT